MAKKSKNNFLDSRHSATEIFEDRVRDVAL